MCCRGPGQGRRGRRASGPALDPIAVRLWGGLSPLEPEAGLVGAVDAALVLLADHELAASTMAARVAASVRADPYAVASAGLAVVSGTLHGGASLGIEDLLDEIDRADQAAAVVGGRLRRGERLRGFGHRLYPDGDPRAAALLARLRAAAGGSPRMQVVESLLDAVARRGLPGVAGHLDANGREPERRAQHGLPRQVRAEDVQFFEFAPPRQVAEGRAPVPRLLFGQAGGAAVEQLPGRGELVQQYP